MSILAYCYGPFSIKKNLFCNEFIKENKDYKLIELHKVRKKITGSIIPIDSKSEVLVKEKLEETLLNLFKKNINILINGLFLNKEARSLLIKSISLLSDQPIKKISIGFKSENLTELFDDNKKEKSYKERRKK